MAGWLPIFKAVPWLDLVAAAPTVARGARDLWAGMRRNSGDAGGGDLAPAERMALLESQVAELKKELADASGLVRALAEQNERLVQAIGVLRARVRFLLVAGALLAVVLGVAIVSV